MNGGFSGGWWLDCDISGTDIPGVVPGVCVVDGPPTPLKEGFVDDDNAICSAGDVAVRRDFCSSILPELKTLTLPFAGQ